MFNGPLADIDIVRAKNDDLWDTRIENLYVEYGAYKNPQADAIANGDWPKVFDYTDDGDLVWLHDFWSGNNLAVKNASAGDRIEKWVDVDGYYMVKLGKYRKSQIKLHKVIYEWHYGAIQDGMVVDHINRDITDNRIENLRAVTFAANSRNRSMDKRNSTGYTGVRYRDGAYLAIWKYAGKDHQKSFSINKYGKERALQLAIDYRAAKIAELNSLYGDECYTSDHGT
jgi:hypothetical protein